MSRDCPVTLTDISEGFESGTLVAWHKAPGDTVEKGELLAEIMTDKVNIEFAAPCAGTLSERSAQEGDTVIADQTIAVIAAG